jgi:2-aminomuconate deaminase
MKNDSGLELIHCPEAPPALGNYSHAVAVGQLVFVSGMAGRNPETDRIPGLVLAEDGTRKSYDIRAETRATLENIRRVLVSAQSSLDKVVEVNTYLLNMKDFAAYNEVYAEFFNNHRPARTTLAVSGLPGNISIEIKVVALR